jgi:hypothetical protein
VDVLAHNIQALIRSGKDKSNAAMRTVPEIMPRVFIITMGDDNGIMVWNELVV